ncbi:helix-turn-helix domain-containing protein [Selenomonas sp.]|uniref:helix-turn-helix domain-containing protein n=1 Tax=Selenomonas sp. TaxID=2053611 RepID=UPI002A82033C|nr:helix-turn-helix domain-containing protein [Selenomonas sp.]MDY4416691.1 helix-turn-helix domain-containing protein [Selenomonas sp.]
MMSILVSKSVLFTSEAATLLSLSVQRVYGLIHSGKLPAYKEKDCRAWKIPAESVTNYIQMQLKENGTQKEGWYNGK